MATKRCATLVLSLSFSSPSYFKRCTVPLLFVPLLVHNLSAADSSPHTLQSFEVQVNHGQPVYPLPANVALGLFNPDPLLDVAYYIDGTVQVHQNLGNGLFELVGERRATEEVKKMEWQKERMLSPGIFDQFSWGELHMTYADGHTEVLSHAQLMSQPADRDFASQPPTPPALDFRERWRSETQTQLSPYVAIADVDNDGRPELVYSFYQQFGDSNRLVIYECVGDDSFRVDWDTVLTGAVGPMEIGDIDEDGHKEIVLVRHGEVVFLECLALGRYRYYETNIGYSFPPFKAIQKDIDHNGRNELVLLTSNSSAPPGQYKTLIFVSEYSGKSVLPGGGWLMSFNGQIARFWGYSFDMAIGQIDGTGREEIVPAGGSFGYFEPVQIGYLWYNGTSWVDRWLYTGLQSGTGAVMFANLDDDTTLEFVSGAPGPVGHGSMFALKYQHDTTWSVLWADSSLRNTPLYVNAGILAGEFVVAGANTVDRGSLDTLYTQLHVYQPSGTKVGIWQRDSASVQDFHILDIDNDGRTNLVAPINQPWVRHLADYEYYGVVDVVQSSTEERGAFQLLQNYPNPFNPTTTISFSLPQRSRIAIQIYDILGREVRTLLDGDMPEGVHTLSWNGTTNEGGDAASGVYFCRMIATAEKGTFYTKTQKMVLMH
jgi:hypothetical protein